MKNNILFSTIISPEKDGIIQEESYWCLMRSVYKYHDNYDLAVKYRNINISDHEYHKNIFNKSDWKSFVEIEGNKYTNQRDLFNLFNTVELIETYPKEGLLCFLDVDTILTKPLHIELDFDIAFTLKERDRNNIHITNMGCYFVNLTNQNKNLVSKFFIDNILSTRELNKANSNSVNFWKYLSIPELLPHKDYLDDYIVQQDYVNSICYANKWHNSGIYNFNGLRFKLLDPSYNTFWYFDEPINRDVFIYHFKGRRQNKVERAKQCWDYLNQ